MSYDICFIKRTDLNSDNIEAILETDVTKSDKHYISMQLMLEIKDQLIQKGLEFEVFQKPDKKSIELNFPTYQVCMYDSQIAISVPYWDKNSSEKIDSEINIITDLLLDKGFTGFDSQMGEFIEKKIEFKNTFTETKRVVEKSLKEDSYIKKKLHIYRNWFSNFSYWTNFTGNLINTVCFRFFAQ